MSTPKALGSGRRPPVVTPPEQVRRIQEAQESAYHCMRELIEHR